MHAGTRDKQPDRVAARQVVGNDRVSARKRQGRNAVNAFAADAQRLPRRGEEPDCRAVPDHQVAEFRGGIDQMLAVVQQDQRVLPDQRGDDRSGLIAGSGRPSTAATARAT